jgi:ribosomal-protein-alanine N-acetyltransferase
VEPIIRPVTPDDAAAYAAVLQRNREFLAPFDPVREPAYFTEAGQRALLAIAVTERKEDRAYSFAILDPSEGQLVGRVTLSSIVRGAWHNANIGYWVAGEHNAKGLATQAVRESVAFAFGEAGLHRVQAAVMPRNAPSIRVVEKAGFRREGLALHYLKIHGVWEDHVIFAVTAEDAARERRPLVD